MLSIIWRDFFAAISACFLVLCLLMVVMINDPTQKREEESKVIGSLMITAMWPDGMPVDIDLWVACAEKAVGYSRRSGTYCDYMRDDLGSINDHTIANFEVVVSRGIPQGEVCINLHYYGGTVPDVPVDIEVRLNDQNQRLMRIASSKMVMPRKGTERTVMCFTMKKDKIVPSSMHNRYRPLREYTAGGPQ